MNRRKAIQSTLELILGASLAGCVYSRNSLVALRDEIAEMGYGVARLHEVSNQTGSVVLYGDLHGLFQSKAIELFQFVQNRGINLALSEGYSGKYNGQEYAFEREISKRGNPLIFGIDNEELFSLADDFTNYNIMKLNNLGQSPTQEQEALEKTILDKIKKYDGAQIDLADFRENYLKYSNKYKRDERSIQSASSAAKVMKETGKNRAFMIYGSNHVDELVPELNKHGLSVLLAMYRNIKLR